MINTPYRRSDGAPMQYPPTGRGTDPGHRPPSTPLALAALIVCIAAFLLGLIPLLGVVLGGVGIVLVVVVARRGLATRRTAARPWRAESARVPRRALTTLTGHPEVVRPGRPTP